MSTQENAQIVKVFFAARGRGDRQGLLALPAEDIEWIIPGEGWPRRHAPRARGIGSYAQKASEKVGNFIPRAPEFVAELSQAVSLPSIMSAA